MEKKIKVASIVPDEFQKPRGGLGVQFKILYKYLKNDFDFAVFGYPSEKNPEFFHGVWTQLPQIKHGGISNILLQSDYLAKILAEDPAPDIIHATDYSVYYAGIYAAQILKKPLIVSSQISPFFMARSGQFNAIDPQHPDGGAIVNTYLAIEMLAFQKADIIIHNSLEYKKHFDQFPFHAEKSVYIPNGSDHDEYKKTEDVALPGTGKYKVLFIGRISSEKNIVSILQSAIPPEIDLCFITDMDQINDLQLKEMFQKKLQMNSNVHYLGPKYDQEKVNILFAADALILPSRQECHPLVMHEALVTKTIFISSFTGDIKNVLDESIGINCGTEPRTIELALRKFADMPIEEIQRRKEAGFEIEKNYDFKKLADKIRVIYKHVSKS